jgi:hypothetical protein
MDSGQLNPSNPLQNEDGRMKTMKVIIALVALFSTCWTASAASAVGGPIYDPATTHTYYLLSPDTWNNAELFSQTLGGHLLTINDAAENNWVYANFISGNPDLNPWTGLNDIGSPGVWHWASGEPVTYLNFAATEPNGIGASPYGANIFPESPYPDYAGQWNDAPTTDVIQGIAEVPEPSPLSMGLLAIGCFILSMKLGSSQNRRQNVEIAKDSAV